VTLSLTETKLWKTEDRQRHKIIVKGVWGAHLRQVEHLTTNANAPKLLLAITKDLRGHDGEAWIGRTKLRKFSKPSTEYTNRVLRSCANTGWDTNTGKPRIPTQERKTHTLELRARTARTGECPASDKTRKVDKYCTPGNLQEYDVPVPRPKIRPGMGHKEARGDMATRKRGALATLAQTLRRLDQNGLECLADINGAQSRNKPNFDTNP